MDNMNATALVHPINPIDVARREEIHGREFNEGVEGSAFAQLQRSALATLAAKQPQLFDDQHGLLLIGEILGVEDAGFKDLKRYLEEDGSRLALSMVVNSQLRSHYRRRYAVQGENLSQEERAYEFLRNAARALTGHGTLPVDWSVIGEKMPRLFTYDGLSDYILYLKTQAEMHGAIPTEITWIENILNHMPGLGHTVLLTPKMREPAMPDAKAVSCKPTESLSPAVNLEVPHWVDSTLKGVRNIGNVMAEILRDLKSILTEPEISEEETPHQPF